MTYQDTYYVDTNGELHFLSAEDHANAVAQGWPLPDPSWTVATQAQVDTITQPEQYTVAGAASAKLAELDAAFASQGYADISFTTAGGDTANFQADEASQAYILKTSGSYNRRGSVPSGFTWTAADNSHVPFTLDDLNGLYDAILDRGEPLFQQLQARKDSVRSIEADTSLTDGEKITQIQAVTW